MQFKEDGINAEDVINFVYRGVLSLMIFFGLAAVSSAFAAKPAVQVVAPQACTQGITPLVANQMLVAQLNGVWVASKQFERSEPVITPLDYAGISNACPFGRGFVKMRVVMDGAATEMWCDIRAANRSTGCFTRAAMVRQRRGQESWLNGASVCDGTLNRPLVNFFTATQEELDY